MWNEAQMRYLEEVLGASVDYFRGAPAAAEPTPTPLPGLVIQTDPLNPEERALLTKILASAQVQDYVHAEGEIPEAHLRISFLGGENLGRQMSGTTVEWRLPALNEMTGSSASVTEKKKQAWALLQQFMREKNQ